jgi:Family of unknown function (DUF6220)
MKALAHRIYEVGIYIVVAATVVQFLLAGLGIFANASWFFWHTSVNPWLVGVLPLVLVGIGWYAGVNRTTLLLTASMFGLVVLQSVLMVPYDMALQGPLRAISALHVVNALLIFWVALLLLDRVRHPAPAAATR